MTTQPAGRLSYQSSLCAVESRSFPAEVGLVLSESPDPGGRKAANCIRTDNSGQILQQKTPARTAFSNFFFASPIFGSYAFKNVQRRGRARKNLSRSGVEPPTGTIHPRQISPAIPNLERHPPEMNLLIHPCFPSAVPLLSRGWRFPVGGSTPDRHKDDRHFPTNARGTVRFSFMSPSAFAHLKA